MSLFRRTPSAKHRLAPQPVVLVTRDVQMTQAFLSLMISAGLVSAPGGVEIVADIS